MNGREVGKKMIGKGRTKIDNVSSHVNQFSCNAQRFFEWESGWG